MSRGDPVQDAAAAAHLQPSRFADCSPSPNMRSKTTRGLFSIGSGMVGVFQENVFWYTQL